MIFMEINVSVYIQIHCVRRRESLMMPALVSMSHYSSPVHSQFKLHSQRHHCQAQDHPRLRYPGEHLPYHLKWDVQKFTLFKSVPVIFC